MSEQSTAAHTRGPWSSKPGRFGRTPVIYGAGGEPICTLHSNTSAENLRRVKSGQRDADARLIAAAPELVEALRIFLHGVSEGHIVAANPDFIEGRPFGWAVDMARAALAKAHKDTER